MKSKKLFRELLLTWHREKNKRVMPWKGEKDPYKVWLSEIILQQTRVEQGLPYYEKFISQYPTITHLANAKEEEVFKLWEGLGYYTRCRNLLHTARIVTENYAGNFPSDYHSI
jgi:A/G-specific adenine glycosylase